MADLQVPVVQQKKLNHRLPLQTVAELKATSTELAVAFCIIGVHFISFIVYFHQHLFCFNARNKRREQIVMIHTLAGLISFLLGY